MEPKSVHDDAICQSIEEGDLEKLQQLVPNNSFKLKYLKYSVEKQAPLEIVQLLAENLSTETDTDMLEEVLEIAVARGEDDEIRIVREALLLK